MGGRIGSFVGLAGRDLFDAEVTVGGSGSGFADDWLAV